MRVHVTIEQDDDTELSMGVSADGMDRFEVARLLLAGAEMVLYDEVVTQLTDNGASVEQVEFGAPLRTKMLVVEQVVRAEPTPYHWVQVELGEGS